MKVPEVEWTDSQRDFVGSTFSTPKGGVLTVTGVKGKQKKVVIFSVTCSICNADTDLFPEEFSVSKGSLTSGGFPCGCTKLKWSEEQYIIRINRECTIRGYTFHGFAEKFKGQKTKLDLENIETGYRWKSGTINSLFTGIGDPVVGNCKRKKANLIEDHVHIRRFMETGSFLEGTEFTRSERKDTQGWKSYWKLKCPKCSDPDDEYVKVGLCDGVFEVSGNSLRSGYTPCRCSISFRWSKDQREYQINKLLSKEGGSFIGWGGLTYKSNKSIFEWVCGNGHTCRTSVVCFLNIGNRCVHCYREVQSGLGRLYGYYPSRVEEKDYLYLILFKNYDCIKVGRSFDVNRRLKGNTGLLAISNSEIEDIEILEVYTGTHQEVWDVEQSTHTELTKLGFYHNESAWTKETFNKDCIDTLKTLIGQTSLLKVFPQFKGDPYD